MKRHALKFDKHFCSTFTAFSDFPLNSTYSLFYHKKMDSLHIMLCIREHFCNGTGCCVYHTFRIYKYAGSKFEYL